MKWSEKYATGSPEVDEQHKTLFEYSEVFREEMARGVTAEDYSGALDFLSAYAQAHFLFEEKCMLAHKCPAAGRNKQEHAKFLEFMKQEKELFRKEGFTVERATELLDFIDSWLDSHICRIDRQLKDYIN